MMKLNDLLILTFAAFVLGAGLLCYCHLRRGRRTRPTTRLTI
jgi:hypothetical protein